MRLAWIGFAGLLLALAFASLQLGPRPDFFRIVLTATVVYLVYEGARRLLRNRRVRS